MCVRKQAGLDGNWQGKGASSYISTTFNKIKAKLYNDIVIIVENFGNPACNPSVR